MGFDTSGEPDIHTHPAAFEGRPGHHGPIGFYDRESFLVDTAVEFLLPALHEGSMAVAALAGHHQGAVERQLTLAGVEVEAARARGNLVVVDSKKLAETLVVGGEVDVERFEAVTLELFQAVAARTGETRICGDLATVLWEAGEVEAVLTLKRLWNHIRDAPGFQLLSLYSTSAIENATADVFSAVCSMHTKIAPIESYKRLVASDINRALILLADQERSRHRDQEALTERVLDLHSELDRVVREASEQQQQLRHAISSRDVIGQAKGILMVRGRIDADAAFAMLCHAASRSRRKLHAVAQDVVDHQLRRD